MTDAELEFQARLAGIDLFFLCDLLNYEGLYRFHTYSEEAVAAALPKKLRSYWICSFCSSKVFSEDIETAKKHMEEAHPLASVLRNLFNKHLKVGRNKHHEKRKFLKFKERIGKL